MSDFTVEKCPCGHPACRDFHVSPIAAVQGVKFTEQQARTVVEALSRRAGSSVYRHKVRGTTYTMVGEAKVQTSGVLRDFDEVVVYKSQKDGSLWVRGRDEFHDGRFELVGHEYEKPVEAIQFALSLDDDHDAKNFLEMWNEGRWDKIDREFPDWRGFLDGR